MADWQIPERRALEAEQAVLGSILLDGSCLARIRGQLTAGDFALEADRQVYEGALALAERGDEVDAVALRALLGDRVPAEYLLELMEYTPTAANAELYAGLTRQASVLRELRGLGEALAQGAGEGGEPQVVIGRTLAKLEALSRRAAVRGLADSAQVMAALGAHRAQVTDGGGLVTTGLDPLDGLLGGGLLAGGLYVVAARPGVGKTALALQLADHMAGAHGGVLYVSLEMDLGQIGARRAARESGLPIHRLLMGSLEGAEEDKLAQACRVLAGLPLYLNRASQAGVEEVGQLARQVPDLACVVIDYFGLLQPEGKRAPRYEGMTQISGALKGLARRLGVPVLCLAQLNREVSQRRDGLPQLTDLRDTGALEQDADGVVLLHQLEGKNLPEDYRLLRLHLAKNRHGPVGVCLTRFCSDTGRLSPASPDDFLFLERKRKQKELPLALPGV